jgi:membrane fusion protein, multidrug efflux system
MTIPMRIDMKQLQFLAGFFVTAAFLFTISGCGQSDAKTEPQTARQQEQAIPVKVEEVHLLPFTDALQVTGIVKAYQDVMLSPEEGGVVKQWLVKKGETVKKGQVLGILNDDVIKASYDAAQAQYKLAQINYNKQGNVYKEKAISELQFKNSQYSRDAAKAQADLMHARLERTRLRSPIDGIFDDYYFDEGEFAPPAVPVAHIVNIRAIKIAADVSEQFISEIRLGSPARIIPDSYPNDTLDGRINYVGSTISASNRTMPVEIDIPNPGLKLKPEMIARVRIVRSQQRNAILVNQEIIQQVDRGKMVVFVERDGVAEQRVVKVGARQGELVEVVEGLKPGDRLIISGFQKLVNGQMVVING